MSARTPRETPTPMPAFAPLLRPLFGCGLADLPVAVAAAALGVPDDEEDAEADVVVGVDVDVDMEEDVVAAAIDVDHVVAERSDCTLTRKFPLLELLAVPMRGPFVSFRFR